MGEIKLFREGFKMIYSQCFTMLYMCDNCSLLPSFVTILIGYKHIFWFKSNG